MMSVYPSQQYQLLNQQALSNGIRRLLVDFVTWTTALIYAVMFGTQDPNAVIERLSRTAVEYQDLLSQFYPPEITGRTRDLLTQMVRTIADLAAAYRDGDPDAVVERRQHLYDVANALASLYAQINRYWDLPSMQYALYQVVHYIETQIARNKEGDYAGSIQAHDALMEQIYLLSDELAFGLLRVFQLP